MHHMLNYVAYSRTEGSKRRQEAICCHIVAAAQTHTEALSILYLYLYLLIEPICAYLIYTSIALSPTISPSLPACHSVWADAGVMDRGIHSNYSISLITLSQVGQPINALIQMDPATLPANAPAS